MELIPQTVKIGDGSLLSLYIVMAPNFGTNTTGTHEFKFDPKNGTKNNITNFDACSWYKKTINQN